ncbi:MAG: hypothetical protein J1E43_06235 [Christensenellaceae bacterium]|nr:hypothetical protein [Christensenellaceae bacterium]
MLDEVSGNLEGMLEELITDRIESAVTCSLQDDLPEALSEGLLHFELVLADGTHIRPREHMRLLSPDKSKQLLCCGDLGVDGCSQTVQTRISCWETIAEYQSKEDAVAALLKVKNAMDAGLPTFEL